LVDVGGAVIDYTVADVSAAQPLIKAGKLRALATTGASRTKELADAPTMIEAGNPGYEFYAWIGAFAPAKTDPEVVRKLSAAITDIVRSAEMAGFVEGIGGEPFPLGPDKAREFQIAEIGNMKRVALKAKVDPE
jgi:tripartite-type tricarboxylate transporter receptor subunit TctC